MHSSVSTSQSLLYLHFSIQGKNKKGVIAIKQTDIHKFPVRHLPFVCDKCVVRQALSETLAHPLANLPRLLKSQCRFIQHTSMEKQKYINIYIKM